MSDCRFAMRGTVLSLIASMLLGGCVGVKRAEATPQALQDRIRNGELARPGDHVSVVTTTTGERVFMVTEVDQNVIRGSDVEVPIDEVVSVTTLSLDVGKTVAAAGGVYAGLHLVMYIAFGIAVGVWTL